jgi:hypothetical protein
VRENSRQQRGDRVFYIGATEGGRQRTSYGGARLKTAKLTRCSNSHVLRLRYEHRDLDQDLGNELYLLQTPWPTAHRHQYDLCDIPCARCDMVNVSGRSKGCSECRQRKLKVLSFKPKYVVLKLIYPLPVR